MKTITTIALIMLSGGLLASQATQPASSRARYRVDAGKSRFSVETHTSGLPSMFGHDHRFEVRDFAGSITLVSRAPETASLELTVRADSLALVDPDAGDDVRDEVGIALRERVLESARYPEITFRTAAVTATKLDDATFDVKLAGELRLHGVTRKVTIPARISLQTESIRAIGTLDLRQTDYKITPFSFRGQVSVQDRVELAFDIVAWRAR